ALQIDPEDRPRLNRALDAKSNSARRNVDDLGWHRLTFGHPCDSIGGLNIAGKTRPGALIGGLGAHALGAVRLQVIVGQLADERTTQCPVAARAWSGVDHARQQRALRVAILGRELDTQDRSAWETLVNQQIDAAA